MRRNDVTRVITKPEMILNQMMTDVEDLRKRKDQRGVNVSFCYSFNDSFLINVLATSREKRRRSRDRGKFIYQKFYIHGFLGGSRDRKRDRSPKVEREDSYERDRRRKRDRRSPEERKARSRKRRSSISPDRSRSRGRA